MDDEYERVVKRIRFNALCKTSIKVAVVEELESAFGIEDGVVIYVKQDGLYICVNEKWEKMY